MKGPEGPDDNEAAVSPRSRAQARGAAEAAVESDRLLPGEDPGSTAPTDAAMWLSVYAELLEFKQSVLTATDRAARRLSPVARNEANLDRTVLVAETERLARRHAYWQQRVRELRDNGPSLSSSRI